MRAIATFQQPTSVSDSLKTTLTDDEDVEYLVVAKSCILEVFAIFPDALRLQCSLELWGRITSLQAVPVEDTSEHHLLLSIDHPDPRLLLLKYTQGDGDSNPELNCIKSLSLYERNARPAEFLNRCLVDRKGKVAVASSYVGKLKVLELDGGLIHSDFDVSVRELNILSLCFLCTTNSRATVLAILHRDHLQRLILTSHDLSISDCELSSLPSSFLSDVNIPDADSSLLIPIPPHTKSNWNNNGGILVLGGSRILFYLIDRKQKKSNASGAQNSAKSTKAEVNWPFTEVTAWSQIDAEGTRYLLGDAFGHLALLAFDLESHKINLLPLGEVSPPVSITPLSAQYVFVGSHFGDSQLIRIIPGKSLANGTLVDVAETYTSIAPIMDAVVADVDNSGQPAIVTCSGGASAGSLRVIRNGANFIEDAHIDGIPNVTRMWPLKMQYDDEYHCFLLVTTRVSTHLLRLPRSRQDTFISRSNEFVDLRLDSPTLAAGNVLIRMNSATEKSTYESGPYVVQVTPNAVVLLNTSLGISENVWVPERGREIVLADISPSQVCIAMSRGLVVLLNILGDRVSEQSRKTFVEPTGRSSEISSLTISPVRPGLAFASFVALGFWSTRDVRIFTLPTFAATQDPVVLPHLPRSLLLHDLGDRETGSHTYLMVGLANGVVYSFPFAKGKLGEKKVVALGESPVILSALSVNGQPAVLASGTRSALYFWTKDTLSHSPVLVKDVTSASLLSSKTFPSSIMFSTYDGLVIGRVLELDKLHIRTIFIGVDNPVKLAYHANAKLFGVGCLKQEHVEVKDLGKPRSTFKLLDAMEFTTTYEFSLEPCEEVTAVVTVNLEHQHDSEMFFAVGSMYYDDVEQEPSRGRVLIFSAGLGTSSPINQSKLPHLLAASEAQGCVYALACVKGMLVAAINTGVVVFSLEYIDDQPARLTRLAEWNHNYLVTSLVVHDDQIVTGDAVSSLAVLQLVGRKLITIARDYSPLWPLCIEFIDERTVIGANSDNNLFSFNLQQRGDKKILERDGCYNINETVNKFVRGGAGSFDMSGNKPGLRPSQLLFTTTGRIAVVVDVDAELSQQLACLERNLASVIHGPGNMDHTKWRAPTNSRGRSDAQTAAVGFLDGDLLERFLDYPASSPEIARILSGKSEAERLTMPYRELRSVVELLRSIH